jgi:hypothetical protein
MPFILIPKAIELSQNPVAFLFVHFLLSNDEKEGMGLKGFFLLVCLFLFVGQVAQASDVLSITHLLGTNGDLGTESVQVICFKDDCLLSSFENEHAVRKKKISRAEVSAYFGSAQALITQKNAKNVVNSSREIMVMIGNQKYKLATSDAQVIGIEGRLIAALYR